MNILGVPQGKMCSMCGANPCRDNEQRNCRTCHADYQRAWRAAQREKLAKEREELQRLRDKRVKVVVRARA